MGKKSKKHEYRLDFVVLNSYTNEYIGFEISPSSSHMHIEGKEKSLNQHNENLKDKWEKETEKRNVYFEKYGIQIITFADERLRDIWGCFDTIKTYLDKRSPKPNLQESKGKALHIND